MVGRTPPSAAGPLAGQMLARRRRLGPPRAGPGGPARTRGSAPPIPRNLPPAPQRAEPEGRKKVAHGAPPWVAGRMSLPAPERGVRDRSEEHTSELQSLRH